MCSVGNGMEMGWSGSVDLFLSSLFSSPPIHTHTQPEEVAEAKRLSSQMVHKALAMDGTCTGEHGVGLGKIKYLEGRYVCLGFRVGRYGR